jgi:hypothetical protein
MEAFRAEPALERLRSQSYVITGLYLIAWLELLWKRADAIE